MGKHTYIRLKNFSFAIVIAILVSCKSTSKEQFAKHKADQLILDISNGTALKDFPTKYFNSTQGLYILSDLKNKCDFINRQGKYIDYVYQKKLMGLTKFLISTSINLNVGISGLF